MNRDDHDLLMITDMLALVGELEHARRHAIRSSQVTKDDKKKIHYELVANKARDLRREIMNSFEKIADEDWCLIKAAATIRQLTYEVGCLSGEVRGKVEQLVDQIYTQAFGIDMSGCKACAEDRQNFSEKQ